MAPPVPLKRDPGYFKIDTGFLSDLREHDQFTCERRIRSPGQFPQRAVKDAFQPVEFDK